MRRVFDVVKEIETELNRENDIYTREGLIRLEEEDDVDNGDSGFMLGYLAA